ncbi:MAG: antitoxin [Rubrivivax sp. SCN 70-15]|nr:MAG: antitoxin [Rubrivivax sp. SCN 70-15]
MDWRERIVSDPDILVGKPAVKGTRISVELILGWLAQGWTHEMLLESYPQLAREDILAALAFATELMREESYVALDKAAA